MKQLLQIAKDTVLETPIQLAAWLGLRRGEIVGLKWECIDFSNNTLFVTGTVKDKGDGTRSQNLRYEPTTKTNASYRTFKMPHPLAKYLQILKQRQDKNKSTIRRYNHKWDDFVCVRDNGDLLLPEYISAAFPKLLKANKLRKLSFHQLRHTNISLLIEANANMKVVQEWAGHGSYSTTMNTYAHIQAKSKEALTQTLENTLC